VLPVRKIFVIDDRILVILDEVKCGNPFVADSFLHFHPDVQLKREEAGFVTSNGKEAMLYVQTFGSGGFEMEVIEGKYSPEFGVMENSPVLKLSAKVDRLSLPVVFGYVMSEYRVPLKFTMHVSKKIYELELGAAKLCVPMGEHAEYQWEKSKTKEV
jgi:hypothetical protein